MRKFQDQDRDRDCGLVRVGSNAASEIDKFLLFAILEQWGVCSSKFGYNITECINCGEMCASQKILKQIKLWRFGLRSVVNYGIDSRDSNNILAAGILPSKMDWDSI